MVGAVAAETDGAQNRPIRDKWALVVGISDFENPNLKLRYSAKDASDFAEYLTHEGGFAPDHVKLLLNKDATQRRILSELGNRWLPHVANPDDLVVIFLSTHGSGSELDIGGQNYLLAYDTDVNDLYTTGIPMQRLAHDIKDRVHCDRVVIFLDACHSGAAETGARGLVRTGIDASEFSAGSGQLVIASSKEDQISWESKKLANGVFTAVLLDSLKKQGSKTTIGEMFSNLKDSVQDTVLRERGFLQTPVMKSQWSGNDILIAAKPVAPRPALDQDTVGTIARNTVSPPDIVATAPTHISPNLTNSVRATEQNSNSTSTSSSSSRMGSTSTSVRRPATALNSDKSSAAKVEPNKPLATSSDANEPVNPRVLIVPGKSVARMKLGMSLNDVLQLLGKPTYSRENVLTYWTGDRMYFLSVLAKDNQVSEIAFSSPAFKTETGINLANYKSRREKFLTGDKHAADAVLTLQGGGFKIAPAPKGTDLPVGIVYAAGTPSSDVTWWNAGATAPAGKVSVAANIAKRDSTPDEKNADSAKAIRSATAESSTLIVPGISLAKVKLGMSRSALLSLLGKPDDEQANHLTYWTKDHKVFLTVSLANDLVKEIVFSSKQFATAGGVKVSNFASADFSPLFSPPSKTGGKGGSRICVLKEGGLAFVQQPDGLCYGWLFARGAASNVTPWTPVSP